jgi:hypothetical protein
LAEAPPENRRVVRIAAVNTTMVGATDTMSDDHPKSAPDEDEYGKVGTDEQPAPKPASGEPVKSDEFAHANDDD